MREQTQGTTTRERECILYACMYKNNNYMCL